MEFTADTVLSDILKIKNRFCNIFRITAVMKVETDIIVSKAASLIEGAVALVIHCNV